MRRNPKPDSRSYRYRLSREVRLAQALTACGVSTHPAYCRVVLAELIDLASSGYAWPSKRYLAERCELDERTIRRCTAALETIGAIERVREGYGRGGSGVSARWRIAFYVLESLAGWTSPLAFGSTRCLPHDSQTSPHDWETRGGCLADPPPMTGSPPIRVCDPQNEPSDLDGSETDTEPARFTMAQALAAFARPDRANDWRRLEGSR